MHILSFFGSMHIFFLSSKYKDHIDLSCQMFVKIKSLYFVTSNILSFPLKNKMI